MTSNFEALPTACAALYDELACVHCSPVSHSYFSSTPTTYDILHICESYCNRFYSACGSARIKQSGKVRSNHHSSPCSAVVMGQERCAAAVLGGGGV
jgi:hypothetical protein